MSGSALGVIPARAASTRFPKKVLARIQNRPIIQHVWEAAKNCPSLNEVWVATGDTEIAEVVEGFGGRVFWTPGEFLSGTDRVAFVASQSDADIVVNLQADEPLIQPSSIDRLVQLLRESPETEMATLAVKIERASELENSNVVKVVFSKTGRALYFSRATLGREESFKHIGIYAYRKEALARFCALAPTPLETSERLEQLRALENDFLIRIGIVENDTIAVDTPEDLVKVQRSFEGHL